MVQEAVEVINVAPNGVDVGGGPDIEGSDRNQLVIATCAVVGGDDETVRSGRGVGIGTGGPRGVDTGGFHRD